MMYTLDFFSSRVRVHLSYSRTFSLPIRIMQNSSGHSLQHHAVHVLYQYRKSISTRPYLGRGSSIPRCQLCLLAQLYCICSYRRQLNTNAAFLLLMYDDEVLKPSNSGRLIADLIPDTHAFIWARTQPPLGLIELLNDSQYQPLIVFPEEYANPEQEVLCQIPPHFRGRDHHAKLLQHPIETSTDLRRPLFVVLDGSWREAVKMFRKSEYLRQHPILAFKPEVQAQYMLRKGQRPFQLSTAEVAILILELLDESENASALQAWFDLFVESSLLGRNRISGERINRRDQLADIFKTQWLTAITSQSKS